MLWPTLTEEASRGLITLDVLSEELGELPDSDQYVSIEVIQPGERSGHNAPPSHAGGAAGAGPGMVRPAAGVRWSGPAASWAHLARGSRHVREHLDEIQKLRSERGVPLLDPADPKTKERYGLEHQGSLTAQRGAEDPPQDGVGAALPEQ